MTWSKAQSVFWLAMVVHTGAFAQEPVKPGKWELTGVFKGVPFASSVERVRIVCISEAVLSTMPEKALIEESPQPSDDAKKPAPKCEYSQIRRDGAQSSWVLKCENPTMTGVGSATIMPEQVDLLETLELKAFGSRFIQHTVHARRMGDCS